MSAGHVPHFFCDADALHGSSAMLAGDDARHLALVLRARPGDPVSLADGTGAFYDARVQRVAPDRVELQLHGHRRVAQPHPRVSVVHALVKGRKLDDVVQRLTELGVERVVPVHAQRSAVRLTGEKAQRARARWQAVALAAAKQSRRARLPEIAPVGEWQDVFSAPTRGVVLWEASQRPLRETLRAALVDDPEEIVLAIGPEGGLTPDEVAGAGLPDASLGPTILRVETAALVATAAVFYEVGRLG